MHKDNTKIISNMHTNDKNIIIDLKYLSMYITSILTFVFNIIFKNNRVIHKNYRSAKSEKFNFETKRLIRFLPM